MDYHEYIKSPAWDKKRKKRLAIDDYVCQGCRIKGKALDVHHLTYTRLGRERMADLVSLCRKCHERQHGKPYVEFAPCGTCGQVILIFVEIIELLGVKWKQYTCQEGHTRSYRQ